MASLREPLVITPQPMYKLAKSADLQAWSSQGTLTGSKLDRNDGFVHGSDPAMVVKVASMFFSGDRDVHLLRVPASAIEACEWVGEEVAEVECKAQVDDLSGPPGVVRCLPDGCMHLHLRRPLDFAVVEDHGLLALNSGGAHIFPSLPPFAPPAGVQVVRVNYGDPAHGAALQVVLAQYAEDQMGGGAPLDSEVLAKLPGELHKLPHALSFLAFVDGDPAGLMNCFMGFSTFAAKPLINIHDCAVLPAFRRRGVCTAMMARLEAHARERGCCKITLEVLQGNAPAKAAYEKAGFVGYELDPNMGAAVFWQKKLK